MNRIVVSFALFVLTFATLRPQAAAPSPDWQAWEFMLGEWVSEGPAAAGCGGYSFLPDLQGRVLVRRNHVEFPAASGRPAAVHDDLMVISRETGVTRAVYWDNEGHSIGYTVTFAADGSLVFLSDSTPGAPRFRLTYRRIENGRLRIAFSVAPPDKPEEFKPYLDGTARRK
jgi:hypothetical protein